MATSTLKSIAGYASIEAAWKGLLSRSRPKSRDTVGIDGVSINDFLRESRPKLKAISAELSSGNYAFHGLRPHLVKKPSGKDRLICVPTVADRIVQRALLDYLSERYASLLQNRISYGFVKARNVEDAAKLACTLRRKHPWVFKTDISAFFDRISREKLHQRIGTLVRQPSIRNILIASTGCEIEGASKMGKKRIAALGISTGLGIRQGMPLCPFFANLFLHPFDQKIIKRNLNAIRYADDLIFFANSHAECIAIEEFCREELGALDLGIPELGDKSKTSIAAPGEVVEFLGLGLQLVSGQYEIVLQKSQREAIKAELLKLSSIPELLSRKIQLGVLSRAISSRASGYLAAYDCCTNKAELENELESITQEILKRLYGPEGLGIKIETLSNQKKVFLGLS